MRWITDMLQVQLRHKVRKVLTPGEVIANLATPDKRIEAVIADYDSEHTAGADLSLVLQTSFPKIACILIVKGPAPAREKCAATAIVPMPVKLPELSAAIDAIRSRKGG